MHLTSSTTTLFVTNRLYVVPPNTFACPHPCQFYRLVYLSPPPTHILRLLRLTCSIDVDASAGYPITSPHAYTRGLDVW